MKAYECSSKEEKEFLDHYDASQYKHPSVTVDIVVLTLDQDDGLNILLVKRNGFPYKDCWAIPGGFIKTGKESIDEAAARELKEETSVDNVFLKQLYTFGDPNRDPRTTVISVAYTALVSKNMLNIKAGDDASDAQLFKIRYDISGMVFYNENIMLTSEALAFDHEDIIKMAITRLRNRIDYEDDAFSLLKDKNSFTISELKRIHEAIKNRSLDLPNFRKAFFKNYVETGRIIELNETVTTKGKPAKLYRFIR